MLSGKCRLFCLGLIVLNIKMLLETPYGESEISLPDNNAQISIPQSRLLGDQ